MVFYEELLADGDTTLPTSVAALRAARLGSHVVPLEALLAAARAAEGVGPELPTAQQVLARLVPEYRGAATG